MSEQRGVFAGRVSQRLEGEINRLDVARVSLLAGKLGVTAEVDIGYGQINFPTLSQITKPAQYVGFDHFEEFNQLGGGLLRPVLLSRIFDQLIDPLGKFKGKRWDFRDYQRDHGVPLSYFVEKYSQDIAFGSVRSRAGLGIAPYLPDEEFLALPNAAHNPYPAVYKEFMIEAGTLVASNVQPNSDKLNDLFLYALAEQLRYQTT